MPIRWIPVLAAFAVPLAACALEFEILPGFPASMDDERLRPMVISVDGDVIGGWATVDVYDNPDDMVREGFLWVDGQVETGPVPVEQLPEELMGERPGDEPWGDQEAELPESFAPARVAPSGAVYGIQTESPWGVGSLARWDGEDLEVLSDALPVGPTDRGGYAVQRVSADERLVWGTAPGAVMEDEKEFFEWSRLHGYQGFAREHFKVGYSLLRRIDGVSADGRWAVGVADTFWGDDDCIQYEDLLVIALTSGEPLVWTVEELATAAGFESGEWVFESPMLISDDGSTVVGVASRLIDDMGNCQKTIWRLRGLAELLPEGASFDYRAAGDAGWLLETHWPWVWSWSFAEWLYVDASSTYPTFWAYHHGWGEWLWMHQEWGGWYWLAGSEGGWAQLEN